MVTPWLTKGDVKQATVRYRYDNGPWQQEIVRADANGVFATTLKAQLDANRDLMKLQIVVEAGDDEAPLPAVTAKETVAPSTTTRARMRWLGSAGARRASSS